LGAKIVPTNSDNDLVLLCFRGAKHYWPLCIRQLHLFPGLRGESFPYRSEFVVSDAVKAGTVYPRGLICMKFDSTEISRGLGPTPSPIYVPFRFVERVEASFAHASSLYYFRYFLGNTVDYGDRKLHAYSSDISTAVLHALRENGKPLQDTDENLVIRIRTPHSLSYGALQASEETDRWIALTKQLALDQNYAVLQDAWNIHKRYQGICYCRISEVGQLDSRQKPEISEVGARVELTLDSESVYRVETITNLSSQLSLKNPFHYVASFDRELFDVVDSETEVSQGVLRHEFLVRCRKPAAHTQLKLSPRDYINEIHLPDLVLPIRILSTPATKFWGVAPLIFVGLGIVFAMAAAFAPQSGTTINATVARILMHIYGKPGIWILRIILLNFGDEIKGLLKFGAIILASTGGWLAYLAERRYKLPLVK
jgi:hypothetical protein